MNCSIVIAQIHYVQDDDYIHKISEIYNKFTADLIVTPTIPKKHINGQVYNLKKILDLTLQKKTYLILDGFYNNLPDHMLLIGHGQILHVIKRYEILNTMIHQMNFNIAFDYQEAIAGTTVINLNILCCPYPHSVIQKNPIANSIYINPIGGYNQLVFLGESYVVDGNKEVIWRLDKWQKSIQKVEFCSDHWRMAKQKKIIEDYNKTSSDYQALVIALRDYVHDNNFAGIVLGLSGGIDSALSMIIATDALSSDKVHAVMMPSRYTSDISLRDAYECAQRSGIKCDTINIEKLYTPILDDIKSALGIKLDSIPCENVQARIRGLILMTISNQLNEMVLATGNKSEAYTGYCTLYGDTCGGYAILKDIYKTKVYELSNWRNTHVPDNTLNDRLNVIPSSILDKAPTAELKFNQKDSDNLPEYDILDKILSQLIDQKMSADDIVKNGYDRSIVDKVCKLMINSEYKRQQLPAGPIISSNNETHS